MKSRHLMILVAAALAAATVGSFYRYRESHNGSGAGIPSATEQRMAGDDVVANEDTDKFAAVTRSNANAATLSKDWNEALRQADDYFDLARSAAKAAQAGEGRAAYAVSTVLRDCIVTITLAKKSADPRHDFLERQRLLNARSPSRPRWMSEQALQQFDRCIRLAEEDPFLDLPAIEADYYSVEFWQNEAIRLGDPYAKVDRAATLLSSALNAQPTPENRVNIDKAQTYLMEVVRSKDSSALFTAGLLLDNPYYSADKERGTILGLAACELGFDCSGRTPYSLSTRCDIEGMCDTQVDYRDHVLKEAGNTRYAQLYARSQFLVDLLRREDWDAIAQYVTIDGRLRKKYE